MQETLTFPTLASPPRFAFPELIRYNHDHQQHHHETCYSELSSNTSTPFVSAPSSPSRMKGFYFSAPASPSWAQLHHHILASQQDPAHPTARQAAEQVAMDSSIQANISSWPHKTQEISHNSSSTLRAVATEHYGSSNLTQQWYIKTSHSESISSSNRYEVTPQRSMSHTVINHGASHTAFRRLQEVEDPDVSYSRKSLYASAVPFAWEERPGTPKAQSVASEASNGEDDTASVLQSGSSDFEFSARFTDLEEPPMSPTPILRSPGGFKHHVPAYGSCSPSPSPRYKQAHADGSERTVTAPEELIWPLRPPPRLDNPPMPMRQHMKDKANEHKLSYGSLSSLSEPQSPRSPRKFDIRGVLCGISSPADAVFDPFLVAMEKSVEQSHGDFTSSEVQRNSKRGVCKGAGHHRRTQSSSPLRVFHWDDHSVEPNLSSNGSSFTENMKGKHPIQREIDARHNVATSKGLKRWSFKGFLHRKSESGGEGSRHSNSSSSLRSSGRESNLSSTSRRESCCSSATGEVHMDMESLGVDMNTIKMRGASSPASNSSSTLPSTPPSTLSSSSSNNSSKGRVNAHHRGAYAVHYDMQRAHTEELRKKTFLPYKQGLLGCLGFSSKSYRTISTLCKPVQSVS